MLSDVGSGDGAVCLGVALALVFGGFIHELGHAVAAWVVGLQPRLINLGRGRTLLRVSIRGTWLVIRLIPIGGYVQSVIGPETTARQRFITTLGGPLASLLLFGITLPLGLIAASSAASMLWIGAMAGEAFILASVLIPSTQIRNGHVSATDALRLIWIIKGQRQGSFAALHANYLRRYVPDGAALPPASRHLPEILFQCSRRDRRTDAWAQEEAAARMRQVLAEPDLPEAERGLATDVLAMSEAQHRVRTAKANLAALRRSAGDGGK